MLGENIKNIRKQNGLTQDELASKLHVVRQTVSKWEKNISVPDADLLEKIASVLETDVQHLLGGSDSESTDNNVTMDNDVANELSELNERLASKVRLHKRICNVIIIVLISFAVLTLLWYLFGKTISVSETTDLITNNPALPSLFS